MLPEVRLDRENFQEIMEEVRGMIASAYPEWTDYNLHDPGMTLLELFAWLKEMQQFHLDQISREHRRKFAKLLGTGERGAAPASVLVRIQGEKPVTLRRGTRFFAGNMCFETVREQRLPGGGIAWCRSVPADPKQEPVTFFKDQLEMAGRFRFYPFGKTPVPGNSFEWELDRPAGSSHDLTVYIQIYDGYEIKRNPMTGPLPFPLARFRFQYESEGQWKDGRIVSDETCGLIRSGHMDLAVEQGEAVHFRLILQEAGYDVAPVVTAMDADSVELVQMRTVVREEDGKEAWRRLKPGNGFPNQRVETGLRGLVPGSVRLLAENVMEPGTYQLWRQTEDFDSSGPEDLHYTVDEEQGVLSFGDAVHGMPPEGEILLVQAAVTEGAGGNIKAGQSWSCPELSDEYKISNSGHGRGGRDRESLEDVFKRMEETLRRDGRAVSGEDYRRLVMEAPGLMIRACQVMEPEAGTDDQTVRLVVRPFTGQSGGVLTDACRKNLLAYLEPRRLIGSRIEIRSPEYIGLMVYVEVRIYQRYLHAAEMVEDTIRRFFREQEDEFGKPVIRGRLYGRIDSLDAVEEISMLTLEARGSRVVRNAGGDLFLPPYGVFLLKHVECRIVNG